MRVTPISEADAKAAGLWKRGLYDFEVLTAMDACSKAGNDMIELELKVYDTEGKPRIFKDWLVSGDHPLTAAKVRHFASATGQLPQYERGELKAGECVGKTGRCAVGIEPEKGGYQAKNKVSDYVPLVAGAPLIASMSAKDVAKELDDDIPF